MERDKVLMEKYKKIVESPAAPKIADTEKALFEQLVHNQVKYLSEQTFSGDMASVGQILVPVFRRAFPIMIGKDIVGVQPMSQPTGYAFALRYHYAGNTKQAENSPISDKHSLALGGASDHPINTDYHWSFQDKDKNAPNSLLLIWNSTANRQTDAPDVSVGATTVTAGTGDLSGKAYVVYSEENKAVVRLQGATTIAQLKALKDATGSNIIDWYDNEAGYLNILKNYSGPVSTLTGEKLEMDMPEVGLTIDKIAIEAKTRKLKARYTIESAQDLKAIHGKDMASELIDILTYEISQAVDREIIDTINSNAVASTFDVSTEADGRWQLEKFRVVYTEIVRKSNDISKTTLRGAGNIIIAAPDIVTMLEQLPSFTGIAPIAGTVDSSLPVNSTGNALVGTIGGRFTIYRDIFASTDYATVGYKGASSYDTGVIWSPYIPLMMKETTDQENANPNIIFMERSAISSNIYASDKYYRKITFSDIFDKS